MKKKTFYILVAIFVLVCIYFSYAWGKKTWPFSQGQYQAVQLVSGEVYYGKLQRFPCLKLADVYFVQQGAASENETSTMQLVPLNSLFFGPENSMYLHKSQILWWSNLSKDSAVLNIIKSVK